MDARSRSLLLVAAVAGCLLWAAVEARHLTLDQAVATAPALPRDVARIEESFGELARRSAEAGDEQTLLVLRDRAERGPYPGYAWFLLGEQAYAAGAHAAAVRHYRRAVEVDPTVGDRGAALGAHGRITTRLEALLAGPWKESRPVEIRDLYYLKRRLAGGCE